MSLLDDVSIVVTPNGYKAGELYAVIPVPTLGADDVVNGDFALDSNWNQNPNWDINTALGVAESDGTSSNSINQSNVMVVGTRYEISVEVVSFTSGDGFQVRAGSGSTYSSVMDEIGVYTFTQVATTNGHLYINASGNSIGSITNVSVKEYTAADMDVTRATAATRVDEDGLVNYAEVLGDEEIDLTTGSTTKPTDWDSTTTSGISYLATTGTTSYYDTGFTVTSGVSYRLSFTLSDYTGSNNLGFSTAGGVSQNAKLEQDTSLYVEYFTATSTTELRLFGRSTNTGVFSNVSVKEADLNNVPRIDYTGGGCPHILAEPQRTNVVQYSEPTANEGAASNIAYESFSWAIGFDNCVAFGDNSVLRYRYGSSVTSGTEYTLSAYILMDDNSEPVVTNNSASGDFSLNIGNTISTGTNNANVSMGNNIWRVSKTSVASATSSNNGIIKYTTQSSKGFKVVGWQMEVGSYPTSYIPNFGTLLGVTRNQDIFTRDGIGSLINSTEGSFFVEIAALNQPPGTQLSISLSGDSSSDRVLIYTGSGGGSWIVQFRKDSVNIVSINKSTTITNQSKVAVSWKSGKYLMYIDGDKATTYTVGSETESTTFDADDLKNLQFSPNHAATSNLFFGKVKQLQVYDTALTDEQLLQLTGESGTDFYESYAEMASALTYTIQ